MAHNFSLDLKVSNGVQTKLVQTVVETPTISPLPINSLARRTCGHLALVAADPECGDVIRGTGGFRKVRVARKGMGKSGGARLCISGATRNFRFF